MYCSLACRKVAHIALTGILQRYVFWCSLEGAIIHKRETLLLKLGSSYSYRQSVPPEIYPQVDTVTPEIAGNLVLDSYD